MLYVCVGDVIGVVFSGRPVFWGSQPCVPAAWLAERLLLAGDIESNPGPKPTLKTLIIIIIIVYKVQYPMYIEIRVQCTINFGSSHMRVHACDTEACDMCYVFNVNLTDSFDDRRSQCRLIE